MVHSGLLDWGWSGFLQIFCLFLIVLSFLRVFYHDKHWLLVICNTLTPFIYLPSYVALIYFVYQKNSFWALLSLFLVFFHLAILLMAISKVKMLKGDSPIQIGLLHLVSSNLYIENRSLHDLIGQILSISSDLLVFQEYDHLAHQIFLQDDRIHHYPYSFIHDQKQGLGLAIYSKLPILASKTFYVDEMPILRVELQHKDASIVLYNVHPLPPLGPSKTAAWNNYLERLVALIRLEQLPVVVAGDFNLTPWNSWYLRFYELGLISDVPWRKTWPQKDYFWFPLQIDHIFVSQPLIVIARGSGCAKGSDHRYIWAQFLH